MPPHLRYRIQLLLSIGRRSAVHSAALPIAASPALPAPPGPTSGGVPTAPWPTRCIQQLMWTPSVVVVEPRASERIAPMALHHPEPSEPAIGDGDSAPGPQQPRSEPVAPNHLGSASTKGETEVGYLSATTATIEGGNLGTRPPASMPTASNPGRSVAHVPTRDAANAMEDTQRRSSRGRDCRRRIPAQPILELWFRLTVLDASLSSTRAPMFPWSPPACCALVSSTCRGLNVTDSLQGLPSRASRHSDVRFWKCI